MDEIWKDIEGYENDYQVSNLGRVKSLPKKCWNGKGYWFRDGRILIPIKSKKGYLNVWCRKRIFKVHRLVANAFIPNPQNLPQVNHIDGDKSNNYVNNLEWISPKENIKHSHKLGLSRGRRDHGTTITLSDAVIEQAYLDVKLHGCGVRVTAERHGMPRTTLSSILNKRSRVWITDVLDEEFKLNEEK